VRIVTIVPKDSLQADRCAGITNISNILSKIFQELNEQNLESIKFLFNKFHDKNDIE
jgi:hypothetical protein